MATLGDLLVGITFVGGPVYLGVSYLTGKWPFTRIKENVYEMTRYFTGHKGPALKGPGPTFYFYPFVQKIVDSQGKIETVSRELHVIDCTLHFITKDKFEGKQHVKYDYIIPNKKSAKKFFWDTRGKIELINDVVHAKIATEIGRRNADNLPGEIEGYLNKVQEELGKERDENIIYKNYGPIITNIVSKALDFESYSQKILSTPEKAKRDARAKIINADAEAYATRMKAQATQETLQIYVQTARDLLAQTGINPSDSNYNNYLFDLVNEWNRLDNLQTMAESGARFLHNLKQRKNKTLK